MLTLRTIRRLAMPFWLLTLTACGAADVTAPSAEKILVTTSETTIQVGNTLTVMGQLADANNTPVKMPNRTVDWYVEGSAPIGRFSQSASRTDINGVVVVSYTTTTRVGATFRISARSRDGAVGTSPPILTTPAPAARYSVTTSVRTAPPGTAVTISAQLLDAYDNVVPIAGRTARWSSTGPGGTFSSPTSLTNGAGIATVTFTTSTVPGIAHTVTASDSAGPTGTSPRIAMITAIPALTAIEAGALHGCALTVSGRAFCWGSNIVGQLGDGSTATADIPLGVNVTESLVTLSAGGNRTCGLTADGAAYCWGDVGEGAFSAAAPSRVPSQIGFLALSTGANHICGLGAAGAAYCWGTNVNGGLGNGTQTASATPVPVSGGLMFSMLSAGSEHTCGVTISGAAYCWGANSKGELGDSSVTNRVTPVAVSGGFRFVRVSAGFSHTCGVTTGGSAYCWGANKYGQLGDGSTGKSSTPVRVGGALVFATLSAGIQHTCGVTTSNLAFCWGSNSVGQLGTGTSGDNATEPQGVAGGLRFQAVSASGGPFTDSYYHWTYVVEHTCGITTTNLAFCWGSNVSGELGARTTSDFSALPLRVAGQP